MKPTLQPLILSKTSQVRTSTACSDIFKRKRKSLRDSCTPKAKLPTLSYWFFSSSKGISYFRKYGTDEKESAIDSKVVQLQKSETVFQPRRISSSATLHRLSRIGKQYTKMLGEYDTWSPAYSIFLSKGSSGRRRYPSPIQAFVTFELLRE